MIRWLAEELGDGAVGAPEGPGLAAFGGLSFAELEGSEFSGARLRSTGVGRRQPLRLRDVDHPAKPPLLYYVTMSLYHIIIYYRISYHTSIHLLLQYSPPPPGRPGGASPSPRGAGA